MAFVDFALVPAGTAPARETARADFTAIEWTVIRLARADRPGSVRAPSRLAVTLRRLFGLAAANRLADPRLEALRRAAVRAWHGPRGLGSGEGEELNGLGFRPEQVALLAAHVQVTRALTA